MNYFRFEMSERELNELLNALQAAYDRKAFLRAELLPITHFCDKIVNTMKGEARVK